jgi:hypothetical protein
MEKPNFDRRTTKKIRSTQHVCLWCKKSFLGSSQQNFCSDSDCGYDYFKTRQRIYKVFQFGDYKSELLKLEEQGKDYVMKVEKNDEDETES